MMDSTKENNGLDWSSTKENRRLLYSCELPREYLKNGIADKINDYDFVLYHHWDDEIYRDYYMNSKKFKILDNSQYEFNKRGLELDRKEYLKVIKELQPDFYIVPDKIGNLEETIRLFGSWSYKEIGRSKPMYVIQGKNLNELIECVCFYKSKGIKNIAVPCTRDNKNKKDLALYRSRFADILGGFEYIHLLGSVYLDEAFWYTNPSVKSIDSGYLIKLTSQGLKYDENPVPDVIIDDIFEDWSKKTEDLLIYNYQKFLERKIYNL